MKLFRIIDILCVYVVLLAMVTGCGGKEVVDSTPVSEVSAFVSESGTTSAGGITETAASSSATVADATSAAPTGTETGASAVTTANQPASQTTLTSATAATAQKTVSSTASTTKAEPKIWYSPDEEYHLTKSEVAAIVGQTYKAPKNVIVMIGDGMGANDITIAEKFAGGVYDFGLVLNQIPYHGLVTTKSANAEITDSAAAGTALATGRKTKNGYLGKDPGGSDLKNIAEIARECGKRVGIVTNDNATGATPCAFSVHNIDRANYAELSNSLVEFAPDVLIAQGYSDFRSALTKENLDRLQTGTDHAANFGEFVRVLDADREMTKPFFGFISDNMTNPSPDLLANCTQVALNRLENDKGFFLMVENAATDKSGHSKTINGKMRGVVALDRAVAVVLRFMRLHPDTLLLITSDHETGGVQLPQGDAGPSDMLFTTNNHTATPVRLFAVGYDADRLRNKTIDNTEVAVFAIRAVQGKL